MRKFFKPVFLTLLILSLAVLCFACTTTPTTPEEEDEDITLTDNTEISAMAKLLFANINYDNYTVNGTDGDGLNYTVAKCKTGDIYWYAFSTEEYSSALYKDGDAYILYDKSVNEDDSINESINYLSKEEALKYTEESDPDYYYFDSENVSNSQALITRYYGDKIAFVHTTGYTKVGKTETLTISTMYLDEESSDYPVYYYNATYTFYDGVITNADMETKVCEKCYAYLNNNETLHYQIVFSNFGSTVVYKPIVSETVEESVYVNYYFGETLITTESVNYGSTITASEVFEDFSTNQYFHDVTLISLKQKNNPIISNTYILSEKTTYDFEFIINSAYSINYVTNVSEIKVEDTYFNTTGYPDYSFENFSKIIDDRYFVGWYEDSGFTVQAQDSYTQSVTLYGKWSQANYITVNVVGVENLYLPNYPVNSFDLPESFILGNKVMSGYFTNADCTEAFEGATQDSGYTIYAKFADSVYITFNLGENLTIPEDYDISNYITNNAITVSGNSFILNSSYFNATETDINNAFATIAFIVNQIDSQAQIINWKLGEEIYTPTEYPIESINLDAVYYEELYININFGAATVNTALLTANYTYTTDGSVYRFNFSLNRDNEDNFEETIMNLFKLYTVQDPQTLEFSDQLAITLPANKAFDKFATASDGLTQMSLVSWPTAETTLYAIYADSETVSLDLKGKTLNSSYDEYYNEETGLYLFDNSQFPPIQLSEFLSSITENYSGDFKYFTTDESGQILYTATEWETITLYAQFIEELTISIGGQNLSAEFDTYYNAETSLYTISNANITMTLGDYLAYIITQYNGTNFDKFTSDAEGLTDYTATVWETVILYAQFTD